MALSFVVLLSVFAAVGTTAATLGGRWCASDGRTITVAGLAVLTPGGQKTVGRYSERAFSFVLPTGEWDAGKAIWMELKSPDSARVSVLSSEQLGPPPHDLWYRCGVTSRRGRDPAIEWAERSVP